MGEVKSNDTKPSVQLPEIDRLFPFYFIVDEGMSIIKKGPSLEKMLSGKHASIDSFHNSFYIIRPKSSTQPDFEKLKAICSGFVLIGLHGFNNTLLKGQFEHRADENQIVFFGSLWAEEHEKLLELGLTYSDFPAYDAIFDIQQMKSVLKNEHEDLEKLKQELTIINQSSDLFLNLHSSGLIRKSSPSAKEMLGYEPSEMIGMQFQDLLFDVKELDLKNEIAEIIKSGKSREYVTFILSKHNEKIGAGFALSPVITNNKSSTQIVCVIRNITERLQNNEEIKNLASFPNENPNPIFRIDFDGKILFKNNNANSISNVIYEGAIFNIKNFWTHILTIRPRENQLTVDVIANNRNYSFTIIKRKEINEYNVYGADITDRVETEQRAQDNFNRLNNFLESTNDVYYLIYQKNKTKNFFTSRWPLFMGFNPKVGDVWGEKRECILDEFKKVYDDAIREFQLNGSMTVRYKVKNKVSGQIRWILEEGKIKFDSNLNDEIISGRLTDITASENYRNQVRESEERFQLITESMPVMIWVSGQDNKVSYTNQASRDFFGFDLKEIPDQSVFAEVVHPDHKKTAIDDWMLHLLAKQKCEMQYLVRNKHGEYRWVYEIAVPRFTQDHEFLGYIGTAFDITSERKMFYTLEEEKRKYEMISNKSADIIFLINKEGIIEYVSPSIKRILGFTEQETIGKSFFSLPSEDSTISIEDFAENHLGTQRALSFQMQDKQKELKWIEAVYSNFSEDELGGDKLLIHVRDINEQYMAQTMVIENEAKYRNLFSNMNLGIMEVDNDERILYVNPSFERISGYEQDELLGSKADNIFLTELSEKEINLQERRNRQHGKEGLYEIKIKKKNGDLATWVISGAPTFDLKGKVRGSIGIHWDVTDIRNLETKILFESVQKEKELMEARLQAEEEQRDVIGRDLHDGVGQMLAYISVYFNILKEKETINTEDIDKAQSTIKKTIDEVRRLSRNLAPPAIKDLGFREAAIELIASYSIIPKPSFNLKIYKGKDPDKFLYEHKIMMFRVLQELSSNTFKYANADKVEIKIEQNKKGMQMIYKDDGVGFEMATVKKGIGLKSILSRVEFYGGEVKIKTKPGEGIEVFINLPFELTL
ncbi:MAG: PAS domain S-box protein [Chitinophagaceae bacterium]|nr:PAS domain S-box protein [Chitinophagaceae bacterium]